MKLAWYFQTRVAGATLVAMVILLGLTFTFEVIDEVGNAGRDYGFREALVYALFNVPEALVRDLPLMGLIGALMGLGSLASSSELIAARAAGWSLSRIVFLSCIPGFVLGLIGLALSQAVVPFTSVTAENYKSIKQGRGELNQSVRGLWHRLPSGYVNLGSVNSRGEASNIRWFEFDSSQRLQAAAGAELGQIRPGDWQLRDIRGIQVGEQQISGDQSDQRSFEVEIGAAELSLSRVDPQFLPPLSLWRLVDQLQADGLDTRRPALYLYQALFLPFSVVCLVLAAVGFILGPLRSSPIGTRLFMGIIVGLGFKLVQDIAGPIALVYNTHPLLSVGLPALLALILAAAMFRRAH